MLGVFDLYHKRQKRIRGEFPDVYQYKEFPNSLKVQIVHIWKESLGQDRASLKWESASGNREYYEYIYKILCKEFAVFDLGEEDYLNNPTRSIFVRLSNYFLNEKDIEKSLSIVELVAKITEKYCENSRKDRNAFIEELNERFKENGFGYQYENGQIFRIDSQYIHAEAVKPTLLFLSQKLYQGAHEEFLKAHEHYRHQRYQEAMVECLKAYESTIKIIMKKRDWEYSENDTADSLTGKLLRKGLVPDYWLQYFKSLKNTLTSGVPTARNKEAGHGQGEDLKDIPDYLVSYVLHMTASAILFLVRAEEAYME